jgi:hypothetical protein
VVVDVGQAQEERVHAHVRVCGVEPGGPPSPLTDSNHDRGEPEKANVPLSCVPPRRSPVGCAGSAARSTNCSVARPAFMFTSRWGILDSHCLHSARSTGLAATPSRVAHCPEASSKVPSVRTRPPSEPTNAMFVLRGSKTSACWSGCICS